MISIVVTTKNEGKNLPLLLDSLRDQCSGHEIVIVDSYSKDNTADVVQHYSEFLPIVLSRERSSRGGGRNIGVQLSRGDYVLFLDGDVTASSDLIESYERAAASGADVIAGNAIPTGVEKFRLERVKLFVNGFEITSPSANLCYRKGTFLKFCSTLSITNLSPMNSRGELPRSNPSGRTAFRSPASRASPAYDEASSSVAHGRIERAPLARA